MSDTTQSRTPKGARAAASTAAEDNIAAQTLRSEAPSSVTDLLDKGLARAKDAHEKAAAILEHSTEAFEEIYSCAKRGSDEYQQKLLEIARHNANAAFDIARELAEARTLPEVFERVVTHQRKQFEAFTALHNIAVDRQGNIYTAEVNTGQRVQKFRRRDAQE